MSTAATYRVFLGVVRRRREKLSFRHHLGNNIHVKSKCTSKKMKGTRIRAKAKGTYISLQRKGIVEKVGTITPEQILVVSKGG